MEQRQVLESEVLQALLADQLVARLRASDLQVLVRVQRALQPEVRRLA